MTTQTPEIQTPINICVAGESAIKMSAVASAVSRLRIAATISSTRIPGTGVNEQPLGYAEILRGAETRAKLAKQVNPSEDLFFGIENGIEKYRGVYNDYAVIYVCFRQEETVIIQRTKKCIFPTASVLATQNLPGGFSKNTVGKYMASAGITNKPDDPHIDLCGKHRAIILADAIVKVLLQIRCHPALPKS